MVQAEAFYDLRQQVEDGRAVGGDVQLARIQPAHLVAEARFQPVQAFHQWLRHLVQHLALAAGHQAPPAALEQRYPQLTFQCLQLQADRRLADEQRLSRP